MATQKERIELLATAIGRDIKDLKTKQGDLSSLSTTEKGSLVSALNEIKNSLPSGPSGVQIDDSGASADKTWSSNKIQSELSLASSGVDEKITAAKTELKSEILGSAPAEALDTLKELGEALGNDANFSATIAAQIANRVRYDEAQSLTTEQKLQACENIGIGNPDTDFVAIYNAAKQG